MDKALPLTTSWHISEKTFTILQLTTIYPHTLLEGLPNYTYNYHPTHPPNTLLTQPEHTPKAPSTYQCLKAWKGHVQIGRLDQQLETPRPFESYPGQPESSTASPHKETDLIDTSALVEEHIEILDSSIVPTRWPDSMSPERVRNTKSECQETSYRICRPEPTSMGNNPEHVLVSADQRGRRWCVRSVALT